MVRGAGISGSNTERWGWGEGAGQENGDTPSLIASASLFLASAPWPLSPGMVLSSTPAVQLISRETWGTGELLGDQILDQGSPLPLSDHSCYPVGLQTHPRATWSQGTCSSGQSPRSREGTWLIQEHAFAASWRRHQHSGFLVHLGVFFQPHIKEGTASGL